MTTTTTDTTALTAVETQAYHTPRYVGVGYLGTERVTIGQGRKPNHAGACSTYLVATSQGWVDASLLSVPAV